MPALCRTTRDNKDVDKRDLNYWEVLKPSFFWVRSTEFAQKCGFDIDTCRYIKLLKRNNIGWFHRYRFLIKTFIQSWSRPRLRHSPQTRDVPAPWISLAIHKRYTTPYCQYNNKFGSNIGYSTHFPRYTIQCFICVINKTAVSCMIKFQPIFAVRRTAKYNKLRNRCGIHLMR